MEAEEFVEICLYLLALAYKLFFPNLCIFPFSYYQKKQRISLFDIFNNVVVNILPIYFAKESFIDVAPDEKWKTIPTAPLNHRH